MSRWYATGHGALDLTTAEAGEQGYELAVTPTLPGPPILLFGEGAAAWRLLLGDEQAGADVDVVHELAQMGLATEDPRHPARMTLAPHPWFTSFTHELVYALVQRVATEAGIELIFIKGPTLHAQGLRARQHSGDVDCWVAPGDDIRLADAMRGWGWTPLILPFTGTTVSHSLTLVAGEWGSAIDVHTSFPGMRAGAAEAFRVLTAESESRDFAGVPARTPNRSAHAVLSALHDMRPYNGRQPSDFAVDDAAAVLRTAGADTLRVVERFDAGYVLREPVARAFPDEAARFDAAVAPADWQMRLEEATSLRHLKALRFVPPRQRLRALWRLVWPTAETMRIAMEDVDASARDVLVARLSRVGQSIRKLASRR